MTADEIYVALLDEGTDVWRPVPAHQVNDVTYILLRPENYDADDERWEFPPGSVVHCERRNTRDGEIIAAVRKANVPEKKTA
jgi:hypothetical protein